MKLSAFRILATVLVLMASGCQIIPQSPTPTSLKPSLLIPNKVLLSTSTSTPTVEPTSFDGSAPFLQIAPLSKTEIGQFDLLELEIQSNLAVTNPYDPNDLELRVRFMAPSGKEVDIGAFWTREYRLENRYAGLPEGWKARFTPTETGIWSATAYVANSTLSSSAVTFVVIPANKAGFVRVDPENPRYFTFDNGDFFFPIGVNMAWWCGTCDPLDTFRQLMDDFHAQGGNTIRVWMASWSFGIEAGGQLGNYSNRLYEAWLLDQVFKMAEERGMYIILVLLNCLDYATWSGAQWNTNIYNANLGGPLERPEEFASHPEAIGLFEQRLNYIINRWGYSPNLLAWEWWNEVNLSAISDDLLIPWIREVTGYLHAHDVNHHLTTNSYAIRDQSLAWQMPELDVVMKHEYTNQISSTSRDLGDRALADFNKVISGIPAKPVLMGEFGYSTDFDEEISETTGVHLHNGLWATTFAGYAGSGMYWNWDTVIQPYNLWRHFKGLSVFLEGIDLPDYKQLPDVQVNGPNGTIGSAVAMGLQGADTLLWIRSDEYTAQVLLDKHSYFPPSLPDQVLTLRQMSPGTYSVRWFDPQLAKWLEPATATTVNRSLIIPVPKFSRDLAARIVKNP